MVPRWRDQYSGGKFSRLPRDPYESSDNEPHGVPVRVKHPVRTNCGDPLPPPEEPQAETRGGLETGGYVPYVPLISGGVAGGPGGHGLGPKTPVPAAPSLVPGGGRSFVGVTSVPVLRGGGPDGVVLGAGVGGAADPRPMSSPGKLSSYGGEQAGAPGEHEHRAPFFPPGYLPPANQGPPEPKPRPESALVVRAPVWKSPKKRKFKLPPPPSDQMVDARLGKDRFYSVPVATEQEPGSKGGTVSGEGGDKNSISWKI